MGASAGYDFFLDAASPTVRAVVALDGDKCLKARKRTKERNGGSGFGIGTENVSFTLNCTDRHGVAVFGRECVRTHGNEAAERK